MCSWLDESSGTPTDPVFPTRTGRSLSRDAIERRPTRHHATAARMSPSLNGKHITAHALRHTVAVRLLEAGVDTTAIYLHAHLDIKEKALARIAPARTEPGRYHPPDALLAFLEGL